MERNVEEERAHRKPAACPAFALRQRELPAARKSELTLSRFPLRGKPGRAGSPHAAGHAGRQQKALAPIDAAAPPARWVQSAPLTPLAHPPDGPTGPRSDWRLGLRAGSSGEKKMKAATSALTFTTFS